MATASGTSFLPTALDPYAIETELAKTAYNQPEQQGLMDQYWLERQANKNLYGQEIDQNRLLQQQQMQNALRQELIKQYHNAGTIPGVAEALQSQGAGLPPEVLSTLSGAANRAAGAKNFSEIGSGTQAFSNTGITIPTTNLTAATGMPMTQGTRPDIQIAQMNNAARLAAAALHANAAAMPSESVTSPPDPNLAGAQHAYSFPGKLHMTDEQKREFLLKTGNFGPRGGPTPPSQSATSDAGARLPPAKKDTPANNASSSDAAQVIQKLPQAPPAVRADVEAKMKANGGQPVIVTKPDGSKGVQGASGKVY